MVHDPAAQGPIPELRLDDAPCVSCVIEGDGRILRVSPQWVEALGEVDAAGWGSFLDWVHPSDRDVAAAELVRLRAAESQKGPSNARLRKGAVECRFAHSDGTYRWLSWLAFVHPDSGLVYAAARDIENEKRTLEALRREIHFLRSVTDNIPLALIVKNAADLRVVLWNRMGEEATGVPREKLLGHVGHGLYKPEELALLNEVDRQVLASGVPLTTEAVMTNPTTGLRTVRMTKIPLRDEEGQMRWLLGVSEDVTEPKRMDAELRRLNEELERRVDQRTAELRAAVAELRQEISERERAERALRASEERFRQAQKLEAVGLLAGGVAHDFNNLLSVVLSYSDLLLADLPAASAHRSEVEEIKQAGLRAAALTRQLLAFSRRQVLSPKVLDLDEVVRQMMRMLERLIGEDIDLTVELAASTHHIRVDPGQLEQVIMNLVVNARDAMPNGGKLVIQTRMAEIDDAVANEIGLKPGRYVMLEIRDTGVGIDTANLGRIFEPFFTTKPVGKGTGLGLSTVFGIVKQSDGAVAVQSQTGQGSVFRVYFPAITPSAEPPAASGARSRPLRNRETILLVEDEGQVREATSTMLRRAGYRVLRAGTPDEAIALSKAHGGRIHLLLTDLVMPGMNGGKLADVLLADRPDMRVLLMSGYADERALAHGGSGTAFAFLQKPLTQSALVEKIEEILTSG